MKGWPIFVGGILLGGAGGMLLGGYKSGEGEEEGGAEAGYARNGGQMWNDGGPGSGRSEGRGRRPRRPGEGGGAVGAPARLEDLLGFVEDLALVEDFEEVNFLKLIRYGSFVTQMSEGEIKDALETLRKREEERPEDEDEELLQEIFSALLFARYAELDGPAAMAMALEGGFGERWEGDEDVLMALGMSSWVDADPEGAAAWFRGEGMSDPRFAEMLADSTLQGAFFAAMARHDTAVAIRLAREAGGEIAEDSMEVIARFEKTVEGLEGMLAGAEGGARKDVFDVLVERDAGVATAWLADHQEGLAERDDYVESLAGTLLRREAESGIDWYMRQELTDEGKATRYDNIVGQLADTNPGVAGEWLSKQEDSALRDPAENSVARLMARTEDWRSGFGWAAEIGNAAKRSETVDWILRRGWDREQATMNEQTAAAAEAAGFGTELEAYIQANSGKRSRN